MLPRRSHRPRLTPTTSRNLDLSATRSAPPVPPDQRSGNGHHRQHQAEEGGDDSGWHTEDVAGVEFAVPHLGIVHRCGHLARTLQAQELAAEGIYGHARAPHWGVIFGKL